MIPNNPITGLLFEDTGAIRITEDDLKDLKELKGMLCTEQTT